MSKETNFFPVRPPEPIENIEDEIDLSRLLRVAWRGKWIVAACSLIGLLLAANHVYRVETPMYSATAAVMLEEDNSKKLNISDYDPSLSVDFFTFGTQTRVFKSRHLAEKVVLEYGLLEDPYFNPYAPRPDGPEEQSEVGLLDSLTKKFSDAKMAVISWFSSSDENALRDIPKPNEREILDTTINAALASISVSNERDTYVYDLTAVTPYPELSAMLATAWADSYVQNQRDVKFEETQKTTEWLSDKVSELKGNFETSEAKFSAFNAGTELINSEVLESLNQQLKVTRNRLQSEQELEQQVVLKLAALEQGLSQQDLQTFARLVKDARLSALLEARDLTDPETWAVIESRAKVIERQLRTEKIRTEQKQVALISGIAEMEQRVSSQSEDLISLEQLAREVEASRVIYEFFLSQLKEVSVQVGMLKADSRVLSPAVAPISPSSPRAKLILALGLLLGAFIGAGFVLLAEFLNNKFRTVEELQDGTGYLVMGKIPQISGSNRRERLDFIVENPLSRAAEAMRNLRTSVLLSNVDKVPEIVMVTSSAAGEGKTTVSLALAASVAALEKKVLLVECDIRRRTFLEYFGTHDEPGLVSVLSGNSVFEECLYKDKTLGCDVLFSDKPTINSVDLFSSYKFKEFLQEMRTKYDMVILDTPPVLIVSDARVIAPLVDATLFVARWNKTTLKNVQDGLRSLEDIRAKATGLVLSQVSLKGLKAYGSRSDPLFDRAANHYYVEN